MTVTDSTFSDNSAESDTGQGGAIADDPGSAATIVRSSFVGNQAVGQYNGASGGAIFTARQFEFDAPTTTDIIASSFTDNTVTGVGAYVEGGAIADAPHVPSFPGDALTITGTTFTGNQAAGSPMGGSFFAVVQGRRDLQPREAALDHFELLRR